MRLQNEDILREKGKEKMVLRGFKNNEKEMEQGVTLPYVIRSTVCSNKTKNKEQNEQEDLKKII